MSSEIVVSILCNAYNHAPYIRQCIDGLVMQRTEFAYEILIQDDASTDGTADIIREYAGRYPHLIRPVYQTENQYSLGEVMTAQLERVRGRYIALCEGDDYWTDPEKLKKQVAAMERYPGVDICAHSADRIDGTTGRFLSTIARSETDTVFPVEAVIQGGGMFVPTSSLMFRTSLNDDIPPFRRLRRNDYTLQIHGALRGGLLYLCGNMSVYRFRTPGSWSMAQYHNVEKQRAYRDRVTEMLGQLDRDTHERYHAVIAWRIARYESIITAREWRQWVRERNYGKMLQKEYAGYFRGLPFRRRCAIRLFAAFPWMYGIWEKLRGSPRRG